jgi:hypothetical protein
MSTKMAGPRESTPRTLAPSRYPQKPPELGWNDVVVWQKVQPPEIVNGRALIR